MSTVSLKRLAALPIVVVLMLSFLPHAGGVATISEYPLTSPYTYPRDITTGADGNLWFTEPSAHKVARMTPAGVITEFAMPAVPKRTPGSITTGPDGNLWFTVRKDFLGKMTTAGVFTEYHLPRHGTVGELAAGPDGNVWFTQPGANRVGRIKPDGSARLFDLPHPSSYPSGIAAGSDGNLWFTLSRRNMIARMSTTGTYKEFAIPGTRYLRPYHITSGPDGNLWFTESYNGVVGRITTTGVITEYSLDAPDSYLGDIVAGPLGSVWISQSDDYWYSSGSDRILQLDPAGEVTEYVLPESQSYAGDLTVGPDDNVWFTEPSYGQSKIACLSVSVACAAPAPKPAQPDATIKLAGDRLMLGQGVYNLTGIGQARTTSAPHGTILTFDIGVRNDGSLGDSITVLGCSGAPGYAVHYFAGETDISAAVKAGTYDIASLAPSARTYLNVQIRIGPTATVGSFINCPVTTTSDSDPAKGDRVRAKVYLGPLPKSVEPAPSPSPSPVA